MVWSGSGPPRREHPVGTILASLGLIGAGGLLGYWSIILAKVALAGTRSVMEHDRGLTRGVEATVMWWLIVLAVVALAAVFVWFGGAWLRRGEVALRRGQMVE